MLIHLVSHRRLIAVRRAILSTLLIGGIGGSAAFAQDTPPPTPLPSVTPEVPVSPPVPIRRVEVVGNKVITREQISRVVTAISGNRPVDRDLLQKIVDAVLTEYRKRGYVMAQIIEAEITPEGVLHLTMAEGVIRYIIIRGNTRTRDHTIRQVISARPGNIYNDGQVKRDRARLGRLGIFADISVAPEVPGAPEQEKTDDADKTNPTTKPDDDKTTVTAPTENKEATEVVPPPAAPLVPPTDALGEIDLIVRVKDQPTVNVAATVGYTDTIGAVGFLDLSENNLLGMGHRVNVEWQRSALTQIRADGTLEATGSRSAAGFSYEVPPLGTRSLAFGANVYNRNTVFLPYFAGGRETVRSYERRSGVKGRIGKLLSDSFSVFFTARRDVVGYDPIPLDLNPPIAELQNATGTVGALGIDLIADGRDEIDAPQRGYRHELQIERAGSVLGGNRIFTQSILDLRTYAPILRNATPVKKSGQPIVPILATRVVGGYSWGTVPLSEQFFLGGFDLLRGYDLFSVRGDRFVLGTAEVRVPIGPGLQGVAFTDIGNAWAPGDRSTFEDLKTSFGLGLRFLSPIGPIRLDAAYGNKLLTYISLGQSF